MIISHKHKFIFLHTPKTAGSSLEIALSEFCGPQDTITGLRPKDEVIRKEHGFPGRQNINIPKAFYNWQDWLCFLYYPFEDLKFHSHMKAQEVKRFVGEKVWNSYYKFCFERNPFDKIISRYYWHNRDGNTELPDFISERAYQCTDFDLYTIDGVIAMDKIYKYEELNFALKDLTERLELPKPLSLKNIKAKVGLRKNRAPYQEVLTEEDRQILEGIFSRELYELKYQWQT